MKLNAIQFAAGLSVDLIDEITDLEALVKECKEDSSKIDETVKNYRHLSSFLQGIDYILDYFEDDEAKEQVKELSEKDWHLRLQGLWAPIMMLKWSRDLGEKVDIMTVYHADGKKTYEVTVGKNHGCFERMEQVRDFLRNLK